MHSVIEVGPADPVVAAATHLNRQSFRRRVAMETRYCYTFCWVIFVVGLDFIICLANFWTSIKPL